MGLLSGLEKFGLGDLTELDITQEDKPTNKGDAVKKTTANVRMEEKDFLMDKTINCPVCDKKFLVRAVTTTRLKRREPDFDLRPNFDYIDTVKYDVISCPRCGYSSLASNYMKIDSARIKLIRNEIQANFIPIDQPKYEVYSYEHSIEMFKMALVCAMKKKAKISEKAMICLKLSWLRREQLKIYLSSEQAIDDDIISECRKEMNAFYKQAYEGFKKALTVETPPYSGMDSITLEYMLVNMAKYYKQYDEAMKLLSKLITSPNTNARMKDKCLELKEEIQSLKNA